ncbi:MAG: DsbE family thiol:disulfide interchange protein [Alphaproteobacteria bacterium]|nr:MAG: DsbE family thiol:disulfide interchange protein [Alphaproteobacteria bacterium]
MKKNRTAFIPLAIFALLLALFALPLAKGSDPSVVPSAMIGKPVPAFALAPALENLPGFTDKDVRKGGPVLVNFFASWCLTCGAEHKLLSRIAREENIAIYGVDYKDKKEAAAAWLGRHGNPYKAVGADADGRTGIDWGVYGVPETYVIARDGTIAHRFATPLTEEDYENILKPLLAELRK